MANLTTYFVTRIVSDNKQANDFKSINKKAYPLFKDGNVQYISTSAYQGKCYITATCIPEMKKTLVYHLKMILVEQGDIDHAECGCPAGQGPKGSCKHIAALGYALEEFSRIKNVRDPVACTSQLQSWNQPRKKVLGSAEVGDIKFVKLQAGTVKRPAKNKTYDPRPAKFQCTTNEELSHFVVNLKSSANLPAFLHVIPDSSIPSQSIQSLLPPIPRSIIEKIKHHLMCEEKPSSLKSIQSHSVELICRLTHNPEVINKIERATVGQRIRKRWHGERYGRLTASNFGRVCKARKIDGLVQQLLYPVSSALSSKAIQWGTENEAEAMEQYKSTIAVTVRECGIFIHSTLGYLAASPDGVVTDENSKVVGVIEIKCPFSARNKPSIIEACEASTFYCSLNSSNEVHLKRNHNYFYQVQGQMAVLNVEWCDFIVWTPSWIFIERVAFDNKFWEEQCLPKLSSTYIHVLAPELVYPRCGLGLIPIDYQTCQC